MANKCDKHGDRIRNTFWDYAPTDGRAPNILEREGVQAVMNRVASFDDYCVALGIFDADDDEEMVAGIRRDASDHNHEAQKMIRAGKDMHLFDLSGLVAVEDGKCES